MFRRTRGVQWVLSAVLGGLTGCAPDHPATSLSHGAHAAPAHSSSSRGPEGSDGDEGSAAGRQPDPQPPSGSSPPPIEEGLEARHGARQALIILTGEASYYGDSLAGHHTANGERYDPRAFTAAHRTLPFGTIVRVVRTDTKVAGTRRSAPEAVYVRINDRGPFGSARRILDLSRAAAGRLHMIRAGVVRVRAEILEYGPKRRR